MPAPHNPQRTNNPKREGLYFSAFGESLIEKSTNYGQFSSPYRFNGKELDPETGNYYYGARYYNPVWGIWLGVDALAGEFPHLTPYNFVENNPIALIDPNGESAIGWEENEDGSFKVISGEGGNKQDYIYKKNSEGKLELKQVLDVQVQNESYSNAQMMWAAGGQMSASPGERIMRKVGGLEDVFTLDNVVLGAGAYKLGQAVLKQISFRFGSQVAAKGVLKPLGLGSTGRTAAANLTEQLAMEEIMSNPTLGKTVMTGMKDSRWLGWNKMQYTHTALDGTKTTIHYLGQFKNGVLKAVDDFKFLSP